jgi:hypothetical protein
MGRMFRHQRGIRLSDIIRDFKKSKNYVMEGENRKTIISILETDSQTPILNDWERDFLHSVKKQIDNGRALSAKQKLKINDIMRRVEKETKPSSYKTLIISGR